LYYISIQAVHIMDQTDMDVRTSCRPARSPQSHDSQALAAAGHRFAGIVEAAMGMARETLGPSGKTAPLVAIAFSLPSDSR
jgi:hypothetical protein